MKLVFGGYCGNWLFNLPDQYLEAYSEPYQISVGQFSYLNRRLVLADGAIALLPWPEAGLELAMIFPHG